MFTKPILSAVTGIQSKNYEVFYPVAGPVFVGLLIILGALLLLTRTNIWKGLPALVQVASWLLIGLLTAGLGFCIVIGLILSSIPLGSSGV